MLGWFWTRAALPEVRICTFASGGTQVFHHSLSTVTRKIQPLTHSDGSTHASRCSPTSKYMVQLKLSERHLYTLPKSLIQASTNCYYGSSTDELFKYCAIHLVRFQKLSSNKYRNEAIVRSVGGALVPLTRVYACAYGLTSDSLKLSCGSL